MQQALRAHIEAGLQALIARGELALDSPPAVVIERTKDPAHGDFACPLALALARQVRRRPREIAEALAAALPANDLVARVEVAGPGFINFHLAPKAYQESVRTILESGADYGCSERGGGTRVQVEFVSANPTGPLHVGHGRGAACGAAVASLLSAIGYRVETEYYVNDAGRQMDILTVSVWLRYLERARGTSSRGTPPLPFPANGYRGAYIGVIAELLLERHGAALVPGAQHPPPDPEADAEGHLDALIAYARACLGQTGYRTVSDLALQSILDDIRDDLTGFNVHYDRWFSERSLVDSGALGRAVERLAAAGHVYDQEGARWFRSTAFGDEKDRVLIRENGQSTYFASDVAYHLDKVERGFEQLIDVWGADHHGYISRVRGALSGLDVAPERLVVLLVQFANLYRGGEKVAMSTRSGEFVTLRELREEVGNDAARFFYVMRKSDQHLDFDLDLAKSRSNDNPVYYVQYAHARVCSVLRQLQAQGLSWTEEDGWRSAGRLSEAHELALLRTLARFPEVVESAALAHEPHQLAFYLRDTATDFHTYYNAHTFLVENAGLRNARIGLAAATRTVIRNGLALLGVSAPESM